MHHITLGTKHQLPFFQDSRTDIRSKHLSSRVALGFVSRACIEWPQCHCRMDIPGVSLWIKDRLGCHQCDHPWWLGPAVKHRPVRCLDRGNSVLQLQMTSNDVTPPTSS